jgi:hypothetical protein
MPYPYSSPEVYLLPEARSAPNQSEFQREVTPFLPTSAAVTNEDRTWAKKQFPNWKIYGKFDANNAKIVCNILRRYGYDSRRVKTTQQPLIIYRGGQPHGAIEGDTDQNEVAEVAALAVFRRTQIQEPVSYEHVRVRYPEISNKWRIYGFYGDATMAVGAQKTLERLGYPSIVIQKDPDIEGGMWWMTMYTAASTRAPYGARDSSKVLTYHPSLSNDFQFPGMILGEMGEVAPAKSSPTSASKMKAQFDEAQRFRDESARKTGEKSARLKRGYKLYGAYPAKQPYAQWTADYLVQSQKMDVKTSHPILSKHIFVYNRVKGTKYVAPVKTAVPAKKPAPAKLPAVKQTNWPELAIGFFGVGASLDVPKPDSSIFDPPVTNEEVKQAIYSTIEPSSDEISLATQRSNDGWSYIGTFESVGIRDTDWGNVRALASFFVTDVTQDTPNGNDVEVVPTRFKVMTLEGQDVFYPTAYTVFTKGASGNGGAIYVQDAPEAQPSGSAPPQIIVTPTTPTPPTTAYPTSQYPATQYPTSQYQTPYQSADPYAQQYSQSASAYGTQPTTGVWMQYGWPSELTWVNAGAPKTQYQTWLTQQTGTTVPAGYAQFVTPDGQTVYAPSPRPVDTASDKWSLVPDANQPGLYTWSLLREVAPPPPGGTTGTKVVIPPTTGRVTIFSAGSKPGVVSPRPGVLPGGITIIKSSTKTKANLPTFQKKNVTAFSTRTGQNLTDDTIPGTNIGGFDF